MNSNNTTNFGESKKEAQNTSNSAEEKPSRKCTEQITAKLKASNEYYESPSASSSKPVSREEILAAASEMENMALAHKIAVDSTFEFEEKEPLENKLHKQVKEAVHKVFWDNLRKELAENPPNHTQALALLMEIREILLSLLLPHNKGLKKQIQEVLDTELIQQQIANGTLEFQYYANFVLTIMSKMCAPSRDADVNKIKQESDTVAIFKGVMETLQLMKLDMANFTIKISRPVIAAGSVEYEKGLFKEFLRVKPDGLEATKAWLLRNTPRDTSLTSKNECREVLAQAYLELLTWDDNCTFPETLLLDKNRLLDLRSETLRVMIAATVLLLVTNYAPQLKTNSGFSLSLKNHLLLLLQDVRCNKDLESVLPNISVQVIEEFNALPQCLNAELVKIIESQVIQVSSSDHKIRQIVLSRIKEFLHEAITSVEPSKAVPAVLAGFTEEISTLGAKFHSIVSYNRKVFGEYYMDILEPLE
ncbi:T-complex protein 11-like protein 1 [Macrosteles quadrilineatus]|uniref:T-complex protein 11-like protein 1 n=1 Tax=Macrosteles quadrilineatus TaxID=74068 RepID=UPI0023E2D82C|nr:T-complex protein 11-like protein 1 [Macrosteles quadrilineatus]